MHKLQTPGWCEIAALFIPPVEAKVMAPESMKLGKKPPRLCSLGVRALCWFCLMWGLVSAPGFFSASVQ